MMTKLTMVPFAACLLTISLGLAPSNTGSEVWSIDQSESAGKSYGGTIYIWASKDLERVNNLRGIFARLSRGVFGSCLIEKSSCRACCPLS